MKNTNEIKVIPASFGFSWGAACIAGLALMGFACTTIGGQKNDLPILCNVFEPIYFSKKDTKSTIKSIDVYNKTWECYCEGEAPCANTDK